MTEATLARVPGRLRYGLRELIVSYSRRAARRTAAIRLGQDAEDVLHEALLPHCFDRVPTAVAAGVVRTDRHEPPPSTTFSASPSRRPQPAGRPIRARGSTHWCVSHDDPCGSTLPV